MCKEEELVTMWVTLKKYVKFKLTFKILWSRSCPDGLWNALGSLRGVQNVERGRCDYNVGDLEKVGQGQIDLQHFVIKILSRWLMERFWKFLRCTECVKRKKWLQCGWPRKSRSRSNWSSKFCDQDPAQMANGMVVDVFAVYRVERERCDYNVGDLEK